MNAGYVADSAVTKASPIFLPTIREAAVGVKAANASASMNGSFVRNLGYRAGKS